MTLSVANASAKTMSWDGTVISADVVIGAMCLARVACHVTVIGWAARMASAMILLASANVDLVLEDLVVIHACLVSMASRNRDVNHVTDAVVHHIHAIQTPGDVCVLPTQRVTAVRGAHRDPGPMILLRDASHVTAVVQGL